MTIQERINQALEEMKENTILHNRASKLNASVEALIQEQLIAHLGEIDNQMPEYDTHDRAHSEKVLENIEKLLLDEGIGNLSFLEALVLRLCCYFHDAGMILPQCYVPLMEQVEKDPSADAADGVDVWLAGKKSYADIKKQFYCPDSDTGFEDFLIGELENYQEYCKGLPERPENVPEADYFREKRHEYLRSTHGDRVRVYSRNMATKFLDGLTGSGREDLQKAVGDICASHCWEIGEVKKLTTKLELQTSCPEMACNVRYLAMLLRLGDVLHFSSDRVNQTVYAERDPMGDVSDRHWVVKLGDLSYTISIDKKDRKIAFDGSFEDPKSYYFLQDHLNWMDEELKNYAYFVSDMHGEPDSARYALGLPTEVDRERVRAVGFKPDQDLKFKLEHQKIITLLMGLRLYRDEFMCLRELYQNALDACRCMRAENETKGLHGELEIEFGLGSDNGGDYLYCKDQGTGMTMDIVKNYLLRIGNSYYQSAEFRRANAGWGGKVAPVSEFGIGLLSCYMIAHRIEVITCHHTKTAEDTIWISMECNDDYGYFKTPGRREKRWVGDHGTVVKLYLMDKFKPMVTDYLPEDPEDELFELGVAEQKKEQEKEKTDLPLAQSLYAGIQRFVRIPEEGIPVYVRSRAEKRLALVNVQKYFDFAKKLSTIQDREVFQKSAMCSLFSEENYWLYPIEPLFGKEEVYDALKCMANQHVQISCKVVHSEKKAEAYAILHLPITEASDIPNFWNNTFDMPVFQGINGEDGLVYIDGMGIPVQNEDSMEEGSIWYNYCGSIRPSLTVDRGEIREVPEAVRALERELHGMMLDEIVRQIERHFREYPQAATQATLEFVTAYLRNKFGYGSFLYLVNRLSRGVLKTYQLQGAEMGKLLGGEMCSLDIGDRSVSIHSVIQNMLIDAEYIAVDGSVMTVKSKPLGDVPWDALEQYWVGKMIAVDQWKGRYGQYDLVSHLKPLVSPSFFDKYVGENPEKRSGRCLDDDIYASISRLTDGRRLVNDLSDIVAALTEQPDERTIHSHSIRGNVMKEEGAKRYVIYVYNSPQEIHERRRDKALYNHIPQYREGVEKGWSILFYNYKDGYVIAPGTVDRMEMLKLLPQEALAHDDGLEYYFTDGTRAF